MTRLGGIALLCLACGAQPEINWPEDDDPTGGAAGTDPGGSGGTDVIGGSGGSPVLGGAGGSIATGGAPATGGLQQGGSATGGAFPTGGASTGGAFPTGGTQPTGGASTGGTAGVMPQGGSTATGGAGGAGGSGGRLLWTHDFSYDGTVVAGTSAKHELYFYSRYPDQTCLVVSPEGNGVPHGTTGTVTVDVGQSLTGCLTILTNTDNRHQFKLTATGTSGAVTGGGAFQLPEESRMWRATKIVRRITVNTWNTGSVTVRETWEIRE